MSTLVETKRAFVSSRSKASAPTLQLRYNSIFLPEYVSTVVLSVLISWFFLANMNPAAGAWRTSLHALIAGMTYIALAGGLLWLTCLYRVWYSDVILVGGSEDDVRIRVGRQWFLLRELKSIEERIGTFFGRPIRELSARNDIGVTFEVNECLLGFDVLKQVFPQLCGIQVFSKPGAARQELEETRSRWERRHHVLSEAANTLEAGGRLGFRVLCLFPVAAVDIAINAALNILLQQAGQAALVVYVAPLSLAVSAVIARFVYYYLFTSVILNTRIG